MIGLLIVPTALSAKNRMWVRQSLNFTHVGATTKAILTPKRTCTLAKHFIEQKRGLQNLKVTLIEKVKVKNLDYLEDREGHWQRQLFTMQRHGINVQKKFEGGTQKSFFKCY